MNDDDLDRNMGSAGQKDDQNFGQQSPGRSSQQGQQTGQKGAGQKNNPLEDDDEFSGGQSGKGQSDKGQSGSMGGAHEGRMGGQNR